MHHDIFFELSLLLVIAAVVSTVMKLLRQPFIIGYILTGLLVGPVIFDLIHDPEAFGVFSEFGIALLLFIIGLGLNPKVIKDLGKVSVIVGLGQIFFTAMLGTFIAMLLGFDQSSSFYIGLALTLSSTIIILKIISDKKETSKLYAKIATGVLLVQDIAATGLLILVAGSGGGEGSVVEQLLGTLGYSAVLLAAIALFSIFALPRLAKFIADNQEYLFMFAIAWGIGVASLFELAGLSTEVGALFAGVALASMPFATEVGSRLRPLRDFFIVIFFIVLGAGLSIADVSSVLVPVVLLSMFVLVGNPIIVMILMGLMGYTKRTSFKTGLTVAQISEFSLIFIILARELDRVTDPVVAVVTLVGIITIAGSTYMMHYDEKLYTWFERYLQLFERRKAKKIVDPNTNTDIVLFGYLRGGYEFINTFKKMKRSFLVVDYDPEAIDQLNADEVPFAYGDATDIEFLDEIGLENAKLVISSLHDFDANLFLVTQTTARNPSAIIIARSENPNEAAMLYNRGATYVMMPHYIGAERVSRMISKHGLKKSDFVPSREKHLRYVEHHLG